MKCIATKPCQYRDKAGVVHTVGVGAVRDFDECPRFFESLESEETAPIDFDTAGEEELLEREYELDDLKAFIFEKYGKKSGSRGKEKTVAYLLDCRFRALDAHMEI